MICERIACQAVAMIRRGGYWLCTIHYRIGQMADVARDKGKRVPTPAEFSVLVADALATEMKCGHCRVQMEWRGLRDGSIRNRVVSLQHDRSGRIRFLCMGCNRRHANFPGDTFYDVPLDWKHCPKCRTTKAPEYFYKRGQRLRSYCRDCKHVIAVAEWAKNTEKKPSFTTM